MEKQYTGVIDDGTKEIPITNKFGKLICKVHIRPADISILDRYKDLTADFDKIVAPLQEVSLKNDGTASFDEDWAVLKGAENELKKRIDALFDMDEADAIFATRNPFSSIGGRFFVENVIAALGDIITEAVGDEMKESQKRMNKYLEDIEPSTVEENGDDRTTATDA